MPWLSYFISPRVHMTNSKLVSIGCEELNCGFCEYLLLRISRTVLRSCMYDCLAEQTQSDIGNMADNALWELGEGSDERIAHCTCRMIVNSDQQRQQSV